MMIRTSVLLAALLFAMPLSAQDETTDAWLEALKNSLDLDSDQEKKAREIIEAYMEKNTKELDQYKESMKKILTSDQQDAFEEMNESYAQGQQGGTQRMGGWGRGGNNQWTRPLTYNLAEGKDLKAAIQISDEQVEKIDAIYKAAREKEEEWAKAFREGGWEGMDWQARQKEVRDLGRQHRDEINNVLTEDQRKKYSEYRRNKRRYPQVYKAMTDLNIGNAEEAGLIMEAVLAVAGAQRDLDRALKRVERNARNAARDADLTEEELGKALEEIRSERKESETKLRTARKTLREIVSFRQELILIRHGLLR